MGKKMFSITLALILFTANVIPTFAIEEQTGEPSTDIVQEEYLEQQEENNNNDAVKNIESNKEKAAAPKNLASEETVSEEVITQTEPNNTNEQTEQESIEVETKDPTVTQYDITSPELGKAHITWELENADNVKVYVSTDQTMSGISPMSFTTTNNSDITLPTKNFWKPVYVKIVPYMGSQQGDPVEFSKDIFDEYKPNSTKVSNNVFAYKNGVSIPTITVLDKKGRTISMDNMKIAQTPSKYPGKHQMTIAYKNKYAGLPNFTVDYTVRPPEPESFFPWWLEKTAIKLNVSLPKQYTADGDKYADSVIVEYSKSSNFSNPKKITITKNTAHDKKAITGLSKNTKYYLRARTVKKDNGTNLYSDWVTVTAQTTGNAPSASVSNATTKSIIAKMRKNATFEIKMPCLVSRQDAYNYVKNVKGKRPHLDKFDVTYNSKKGECSAISSITFKYNSTKAKKANAINKKVMKIVNGAKKKKGTRAKVKYVNKQLCNTCTYHWKAYRASNGYSKYPNAYNAYGCLVNHKAVCSGYTDAFAAIMTELNITNDYGHSPNHIWNKVKIGKTWYHVDVTWNDCTHSNKYLLKKTHPKK